MNNASSLIIFSAMLIGLATVANAETGATTGVQDDPRTKWSIHDMNRPLPPACRTSGAAAIGRIVLFDGKDLSLWEDGKGRPAGWKVETRRTRTSFRSPSRTTVVRSVTATFGSGTWKNRERELGGFEGALSRRDMRRSR